MTKVEPKIFQPHQKRIRGTGDCWRGFSFLSRSLGFQEVRIAQVGDFQRGRTGRRIGKVSWHSRIGFSFSFHYLARTPKWQSTLILDLQSNRLIEPQHFQTPIAEHPFDLLTTAVDREIAQIL